MRLLNNLRKRLIILLIVFAIIPLVLMGAVLSWQRYVIQQKQVKALQSEISKRALTEFLTITNELENELLMSTKLYNLMEMPPDRLRSFLSKMRSHKSRAHDEVLNEIALLDNTGQELVRISREQVITAADLRSRSRSEEFLSPFAAREIYYGAVQFDERTSEPYMSISIPIIDVRENAVRGVLVAVVRLKFTWDLVANVKVGETGEAYMVDRTGRVIAHRNPSIVLNGTYVTMPEHAGTGTGYKGDRVIMGKEDLQLGDRTFHIITELPVAEALGQTYSSLITIAIFLTITVAGAGILGVLIVRQVVRPIEALSGTAMAISEGDLTCKSEVSRSDEIGVLAGSFNAMTSRLVETIGSLKNEIAEREKAEDQIKTSLREKEVLLKEVHHRVKNNMQVISSLLNLQAERITDKYYTDLFYESRNRIGSMSLVHEKLYRSKDLANVDLKDYISSLTHGLFAFYGAGAKNISLRTAVEDVCLSIDTAIPCGLIINELVSNSLKHAFPGARKGEININFSKVTANGSGHDYTYNLVVSDNGAGMPEGLDIRKAKSLGLQLIVNLVEHQLQGSVKIDRSEGTLFNIHLKELKYKTRM